MEGCLYHFENNLPSLQDATAKPERAAVSAQDNKHQRRQETQLTRVRSRANFQ